MAARTRGMPVLIVVVGVLSPAVDADETSDLSSGSGEMAASPAAASPPNTAATNVIASG